MTPSRYDDPVPTEVATLRDELVAANAQLGDALGTIRELEDELARYRRAADELTAFKRSPFWLLYAAIRGVYRAAKHKVATLLRALVKR